jgi:hypothetical protein
MPQVSASGALFIVHMSHDHVAFADIPLGGEATGPVGVVVLEGLVMVPDDAPLLPVPSNDGPFFSAIIWESEHL